MDASKKQALTAAGINVEEVLGRFMGNEALLERMLKKFLSDPTYSKLQDAADTAEPDHKHMRIAQFFKFFLPEQKRGSCLPAGKLR